MLTIDDLAYKKSLSFISLRRARVGCVLGIVLVPAGSLLDYFVYPERFYEFLLVRCVCSILIGAILFSAYLRFGREHPVSIGQVFVLLVAIAIVYMIRETGGYQSTYYAGLNLLILAVGVLFPWGLRETLACGISVYLVYLVPILLFDDIVDLPSFVNNNYFLILTLIIALTGNHFSSGLRYQEFLSRRRLEESEDNLRSSNQRLKELDTAKSDFFANISHELRTPLTLILAPMESLLKGESGPVADVHRRYLQIMHQNALRLLKQINSLLDLAKLDAGRMQLHHRSGDLAAFFRGLIASIVPMAEKKHITLTGREETSLPSKAYFDHDQLEKVVLNLVFNALKFTPSGGRIEVRWGLSSGGEIRVQIIDSGIGIAADDLPKLFKRFSQVDAATNRRYEGTGIGLALAKEIIELHGGRIEVTSEVGRGTTMSFVIPLRIEPPGNSEEGPEQGAVPPVDWTRELHAAAEHQQITTGSTEPQVLTTEGLSPANGVQVLVVEDNHDMREFIAFQLQGDYRVLKAHNGVDGLRIAAEVLPDLIVSDVMMPEKDGYQLCREIRADAKTMHIPIILLTARADMAMKIEGLEHGADDYLTKPFNAQELRAKIKSLLALRKLEREIQQRNEALEAALAELKATQSQLVQSEKMAGLGLLVAGMAHEINNPINFAKNSLTILERAWGELKPLLADDAQRETIEDLDASVGIVKTGVQRTEQLVTQLKVFARKDQGMAVRCPVQEGLESTLRLIRPTVESGVVLRTDFQANGWISVVPGKLNQVWMNLLQNAIQAVGSSGEVWVTSRDHEHVVSVSVRDTGPGIKAEHVSKLFEPFFTTKPVGQGTGLGLSVSYQIIQDAGGRIEVKSEEGHGAEFTVFLPRVAALERIA